MKIKNQKSKIKIFKNFLKTKELWMLSGIFYFLFFIFYFSVANATVPVWVKEFDKCTQYQTSHENFQAELHLYRSEAEYKARRQAELRDIIKAREDVNKLVATVYNELRTQQVIPDYGQLRNVLQSVGIAVVDEDEGEPTSTDEMCKAAYQVKADVDGTEQCVAVAQEARIITNQDDYIYEESRRRGMDMLFCYLGEWRHFPIGDINDQTNCEQLDLESDCTVPEVWDKLGELLGQDLSDIDGTVSPAIWDDDQHVYNLCEGMRALGFKCAQDMLRDYIKYSTIDTVVTRKDRTIILAPPQTWYTPFRCRIIDAFLPAADQTLIPPGHETPYTKNIKSLELINTANFNSSFEYIDTYFGSRFGSATLGKPPSNMDFVEYSVNAELQAINVPENSFSGLAAKTEALTRQIITEVTELRKLQYTTGEGLRDATLRIGWQDYEWDGTIPPHENGVAYLGKYPALDLPIDNAKNPNKIFKPLPCYWGTDLDQDNNQTIPRCIDIPADPSPIGKFFYFDTGIIVSPIIITKDKIQSAIQAQFDLAQKAFNDDTPDPIPLPLSFGECGASGPTPDFSIHAFLPAPWEDAGINLASAINPLTGEPYLGDSFRIPDLPENYFNILYNDVFQLYHTPFPEVLERWFRLNTPGYDSIYSLDEAGGSFALGPTGKGPHFPDDDDPTTPPGPGDPTGPLPTGCENFDFTGYGVPECLLKAIAAAESSCNPNAESPSGSCGLMQILPSTAGTSCDELKANPELSIQIAANYLQTSAGIIGGYKAEHGFDIGNQFTQTGQTVSYGSNVYNTGNDDLIASYNAGWGDSCGNPKQGFCPSSDCPSPPTPAWQCHIDPGGFSETQIYVQRVQDYQAQCESGLTIT